MRKLTAAVLLLFISSAVLAHAQQSTAYQALKQAGRINPAYLSRVVSITGVDGDPQPTRWNILVGDRGAPGGMRQIQVANGRVVSNASAATGVVGSAQNAMFAAGKLNLDSSGAFKVASYTANTSHTNFDLVSYTLRTNDRGIPVWIVTLQDNTRQSLGTIHINATKGNVTRVEGLYRGANMAQVGDDQRGQTHVERIHRDRPQPEEEYVDGGSAEQEEITDGEDDENVVKAEIKRMFRRTKEGARHVFDRARESFEDFWNR